MVFVILRILCIIERMIALCASYCSENKRARPLIGVLDSDKRTGFVVEARGVREGGSMSTGSEKRQGVLRGVSGFYRDGFRRMTVGRTLWKIILLKLFVMFAILKLFFFPDFLATEFSTDLERAGHVLEEITTRSVRDR